MVWEIVFMLLILKIPIVYLCVVVWYAIRDEPRPADPVRVAVAIDTPLVRPPVGARGKLPRRGGGRRRAGDRGRGPRVAASGGRG